MKRVVLFRAVSICLLLAWMLTIFMLSSQNASESSDTSYGFVQKITSLLYPQYDNLSSESQVSITDTVTLIIRKSAHFFEYFILGVLTQSVFIAFGKYRVFLRGAVSVIFDLLYAVSDEIHQYFVPGRACRFVDVCIDFAGIASAVFIITIITCKIKDRGGLNA